MVSPAQMVWTSQARSDLATVVPAAFFNHFTSNVAVITKSHVAGVGSPGIKAVAITCLQYVTKCSGEQ